MFRPIPGGLLIAVEGIDGAGKTSVASLLAQWCGERGLGCVISKEPTGLKWGTELRASAKAGRLTLKRELELFALDRQDHVKRSIMPALVEGNIVILDRYYWSTAAYQGARGADADQIITENEIFAPVPDLVLVLDVDVELGLSRIRGRGDSPNLFEAQAALEESRRIFLMLAEKHKNAVLLDASGQIGTTFPQALQVFQKIALQKIERHSGEIGLDAEKTAKLFFGGQQLAEEYEPVRG